MKIGIIGEQNNYISYSMLQNSLKCTEINVIWFVEARIPEEARRKIYGATFKKGALLTALGRLFDLLTKFGTKTPNDCKSLCDSKKIPYIVPANNSINAGLPEQMYANPEADYVLIAGCDQLLNKNGLKVAKKKVINYHYSPLPAYRGKNVVFWQWYNKEPYIGYSFHEVDLGLDSGDVIYQGKIDYDVNESIAEVSHRVISLSSENVCKMFECLINAKKVLLFADREISYYHSRKYLNLVEADPVRRVEDILTVFKRLGYVKLKNGLYITRITSWGETPTSKYLVDGEGITIPLADGYVKGAFRSKLPFRLYLLLQGRKNILRGLN